MKVMQRAAQQIIWLVIVVVVIVAAILVFPSISRALRVPATAVSQSTQVDFTPTLAAYPGPEVSAQLTAQALASLNPSGYPGPEATRLAQDAEATRVAADATSAVVVATMWAEATVSAQAPMPTPILLVGPRTLIDSTGQYSLDLPEGWWGYSIAGTMLTNYDSDQLEDVHQFPPGGIKVSIGVSALDGRTATEALVYMQAVDVSSSNEMAPGSGDRLKFTDVQPLQLGPYAAFEYYMTTSEQTVVRYIAFSHEEHLIFVLIAPAESPAMSDALKILLTLKFLPS